jgi:hypothetical protein
VFECESVAPLKSKLWNRELLRTNEEGNAHSPTVCLQANPPQIGGNFPDAQQPGQDCGQQETGATG